MKDKYISDKAYVQYAIISNYVGCYRAIIVTGYEDVRKIIKFNNLIEGELIEFDGQVIFPNVKKAIDRMEELNQNEDLDPVECFEKALPKITEKLQEPDRNQQFVVSVYRFIDDCHYTDQRYKGYFLLKKVVREYHY